MFKLFHPNKIFQITSKAPKYVMILFVMVISVGLTEALILSPEDYKQSDAVRIMYVHVPAAWISLGIFSSITFLSISGFIFKNNNFFLNLSLFFCSRKLVDFRKRDFKKQQHSKKNIQFFKNEGIKKIFKNLFQSSKSVSINVKIINNFLTWSDLIFLYKTFDRFNKIVSQSLFAWSVNKFFSISFAPVI